MHIAIISGSHRPKAQSLRISEYIAKQLPKLDNTVTTDLIALTNNPLPLWDERMWDKNDNDLKKLWQPYSERLQKAEGFVVVSPEWNGMVPAGLKNFFLYTSPKDVGHKAAMIVGVSASRGGAYPVQELRISSYKNSMINYIPEHIIVREAEKMFVDNTPADKNDEYIHGRMDFALRILLGYTKALTPLRESGIVFDKRYANGM